MILSGEKREEYREITDYWKARMRSAKLNQIDNITFSNGYSKNRKQLIVKLEYISIRSGLKVWGAVPNKVYFVLHLGRIISFSNIGSVSKKQVKT